MKLKVYSLIVTLFVVLAACSGTTDSGGEVSVGKGINAQEVFEKSIAAQEDVTSFKMMANMNQTIGSGEEEMEVTSQIESDMVMDPMAFHQMIDMKANGEVMQMESYFTKAGFFMKQGEEWMIFPDEMTDTLLTMQQTQADPSEQMNMLKEYVDEFKLTENEDTYVMTMKASGDKFQELLDKTVEEMGAQSEMLKGATEQMKVNKVEYTLTIGKDDFLTKEFQMKMDSEMTMEDETISMLMEMDSRFENYNEIEEITVPEEVLQQAKEMPGIL
ncbi:DUF6612 family protein [Pseudalkalibacillus hwajinpoensis]|uniref:Lipoprotein n=1 Tax=Guptibacillus hwajinpoensis TaxID=208199 RepID=A0A4U1MMM4_9BACL|nr:DUF6612 family protein [Pseudalkalibacillus hwajinpoensis]TKD71981.1 hypothetical protein FBF83_04055 [Pseudalkalibacillus hwajinpoensis]